MKLFLRKSLMAFSLILLMAFSFATVSFACGGGGGGGGGSDDSQDTIGSAVPVSIGVVSAATGVATTPPAQTQPQDKNTISIGGWQVDKEDVLDRVYNPDKMEEDLHDLSSWLENENKKSRTEEPKDRTAEITGQIVGELIVRIMLENPDASPESVLSGALAIAIQLQQGLLLRESLE